MLTTAMLLLKSSLCLSLHLAGSVSSFPKPLSAQEEQMYLARCTQGDLEASRKAGIPFVFCRYGFGDPVEWDAAVDAFPELLNLFPGEA